MKYEFSNSLRKKFFKTNMSFTGLNHFVYLTITILQSI
ncbi:hypothetical protein LEP1GSC034_0378 [Leptospira interrogans str. 2003000735]|uniref:Uncharacterized protein n=11 Tax=Leptospira interrogans TaxID=173 RepID=A0A0E2D1R3_LEPIR|nr:hypothetical protein LEP1GSC045_2882 [Leptospira interrogans serovar Pomona str. Kennewicki LC82-25]EJP03549.1 hypothetical protein LEP1GSC007_2157 [Leptospira interrogans serovar Bulgarica str. Mallika]EJP16031.1 hypothetical protein LEP1GSC080_1112 [Leptospira interrogans str. FPW2026]EKN87965.1 hypothetical protein LEP1GSC027_1205 [Leptospira interrogans str. 2002000624]EKN95499.1 hypothetical protein LEP1GSC014_0093 [Leptospira interrogans serovar Pomona str. Pomona]EKO04531.1 hypotheti